MKITLHPRRSHAFTLVEILISMGILIVIISAVYASWTAILRSSKVGIKAAEEAQQSRMAMKCMEQALASTVYFTENSAYYSFETDTSTDFAYLSFATRLSPDFPGAGLFPNEPTRRVTFEVVQGPNGGNDLRMTQMPLLQILQGTEEAYPITLVSNVSHFTLEFWDDQSQDWAYEWTDTNSVPQLIRFSVGLGKAGNSPYAKEEVQSKTVFIAGMAISKDYQFPDATAAGGANGRGNGGRGGKGNGKGNPNPTLNPNPQPRPNPGPGPSPNPGPRPRPR